MTCRKTWPTGGGGLIGATEALIIFSKTDKNLKVFRRHGHWVTFYKNEQQKDLLYDFYKIPPLIG